MDESAAPDDRLTLSIPRVGLTEVFRGWSGEGSLYSDLAAVASPDALDWTAADIRRRARRVLLSIAERTTDDWPQTKRRWEEFLPLSATVGQRVEMRVPTAGINWRESHRRHGWPARAFVGRRRERTADEVTLTTLAWLVRELSCLVADVQSQSPTTAECLAHRIATIEDVLSDWSEIAPVSPDRLDLLALASSGYPWRTVAATAEIVLRAERDPSFVAYELIAPDPRVGWRLFHLASYGMVIRSLRNHRFVVTWRRPISGTRTGAQVEAIGPSGTRFDLWFEAAAARTAYGLAPSAYHDAVESIQGAGGPIGVDVMLVAPGSRALLFECKWGDARYVGRYGYHQSASYALDTLNGIAESAWSFVVGPHDVVPTTNVSTSYEHLGVLLGSTSPGRISDVVSAFLADDPSTLS